MNGVPNKVYGLLFTGGSMQIMKQLYLYRRYRIAYVILYRKPYVIISLIDPHFFDISNAKPRTSSSKYFRKYFRASQKISLPIYRRIITTKFVKKLGWPSAVFPSRYHPYFRNQREMDNCS